MIEMLSAEHDASSKAALREINAGVTAKKTENKTRKPPLKGDQQRRREKYGGENQKGPRQRNRVLVAKGRHGMDVDDQRAGVKRPTTTTGGETAAERIPETKTGTTGRQKRKHVQITRPKCRKRRGGRPSVCMSRSISRLALEPSPFGCGKILA